MEPIALTNREKKFISFYEELSESHLDASFFLDVRNLLNNVHDTDLFFFFTSCKDKYPNSIKDFSLLSKNAHIFFKLPFIIKDNVLTKKERKSISEYENEVIRKYEYTTKLPFNRSELIVLKELLKFATPAQINNIIYRLYKSNPTNFTDFSYISPMVKNMFFGRRGKKSSGGNHE